MFVGLKEFKALIKEAYKGAGLYVARRGDWILFGGSYWTIATDRHTLDKKALAAVIELTGEMPEDGGALKATKECNQYEINEVYWEMIDSADANSDTEEELTITCLVLEKYKTGKTMRILQAAGGRTEAIYEKFVEAIDPVAMNKEYEYEIEGPLINHRYPKQVYWRSEATKMIAFLMCREDMQEKDLLNYLQDTTIGQ